MGRLVVFHFTSIPFSVHPHACGEIIFQYDRAIAGVGSSPRLWGDSLAIKCRFRFGGSSPRLWGDFCHRPPAFVNSRFIPTPVGRFSSSRKVTVVASVHPHACGEILIVILHIDTINGSSPRLWGDLRFASPQSPIERFIPTPVGRFFLCTYELLRPPVHPHACGEIDIIGGDIFKLAGSSPRLWGDCLRRLLLLGKVRFIPTPVGRFPRSRISSNRITVHPHACGEICAIVIRNWIHTGSSPRLWGDSEFNLRVGARERFIPTPVGRFMHATHHQTTFSVHPHACGEIHHRHKPGGRGTGSSPRLWGDW